MRAAISGSAAVEKTLLTQKKFPSVKEIQNKIEETDEAKLKKIHIYKGKHQMGWATKTIAVEK